MAQYKACCPMVIPILSETNTKTEYGTGKWLDKLMRVKVSPEYDTPTVYADDGVAEQIHIFKNAGVELGTTTIPAETEPIIFGNTYDATKQSISDKEDDTGSFCGFAFFICERIDGEDVYIVHFLKKVRFKMPADEFETKGETISFKTPVITGTAYADKTGQWRDRHRCKTPSESMNYIYDTLGGNG